jgi:anti-anti-sigma regulatory factor
MFSSQIDQDQRLVTISVSGQIDARDAKACLENLRSMAADLKPGFRFLGDLSGVTSMSTSAAPYIGKIMELLSACGIKLVVRILPPEPKNDIGFSILSRFHYARDVRILGVENIEEARALLSE